MVTVNASTHGHMITPSAVVSDTLELFVTWVLARADPVRMVLTVMVLPVAEVVSLVETPTIRYLPPATPGHARE